MTEMCFVDKKLFFSFHCSRVKGLKLDTCRATSLECVYLSFDRIESVDCILSTSLLSVGAYPLKVLFSYSLYKESYVLLDRYQRC